MAGYDDGRIACDAQGLLIRHYYLARAKRIRYSAIREVVETPLGAAGRWRIHGSGDFSHWFNYDPRRPRKDTALVLTLDTQRIQPVITPDDPARVVAELTAHGVRVTQGRETGLL
jgi:hypothetical protein